MLDDGVVGSRADADPLLDQAVEEHPWCCEVRRLNLNIPAACCGELHYTRECLVIEITRRLYSDDVLFYLAELFVLRGVPTHIRANNSPKFAAKAVRHWLQCLGVRTLFIEPGSP
jgi:hypothetical protein